MLINTPSYQAISAALATLAGVLILYLYMPSLQWLGKQLTLHPLNAIIIAALLVMAWLRARGTQALRVLHLPTSPIILLVSSISIYVWNENAIGIHIFSATCLIGTLYSLLGFILPTKPWQRLALPFIIITLLLPFSSYLDVYLGFPLRLFCAEQAAVVLSLLGFPSVQQESLLLFEQQAVNVDLACSGIKGLWTGCIFFLILSLIENSRINLRWLGIALLFLILLLVSNIMRIVILVFLDVIAGFSQLADMLHQALGLIGFSVSCLIAWFLLQTTHSHQKNPPPPTPQQSSQQPPKQSPKQQRINKRPSLWILSLLVIALACAVLLHQPYQSASQPNSTTLIDNITSNTAQLLKPLSLQALPLKSLSLQPLPLMDIEQQFFASNQAHAKKFAFNTATLSGSILFVSSAYWKAQHEPRNCYLAQGFDVGLEGTWLLKDRVKQHTQESRHNPRHTVRFMHTRQTQQTAVYWFQSIDTITANYSARVFDGLFNPHNPWLLVSILFNQSISKQDVEPLLEQLQQQITTQLSKEVQRSE